MRISSLSIILCCALLSVACTDDAEPAYYEYPARIVPRGYVSFVEEGKTWVVKGEGADSMYVMHGDTIINDVSYKKVALFVGDEERGYVCAMREKDMRVFVVGTRNRKETLMYDFGLENDEDVSKMPMEITEYHVSETHLPTDSVPLRIVNVTFLRGMYAVAKETWVTGFGHEDKNPITGIGKKAYKCLTSRGTVLLNQFNPLIRDYGTGGWKIPWDAGETQMQEYARRDTDSHYQPMLVDGKSWICSHAGGLYTYNINGDTLINGCRYWKVFLTDPTRHGDGESHYALATREESKRVFILFPYDQEPHLLYDYGIASNEWLYGYGVKIRADGENLWIANSVGWLKWISVVELDNTSLYENGVNGKSYDWVESVGSINTDPFDLSYSGMVRHVECPTHVVYEREYLSHNEIRSSNERPS